MLSKPLRRKEKRSMPIFSLRYALAAAYQRAWFGIAMDIIVFCLIMAFVSEISTLESA